ncbi:MAG: RloC protein, partial [Flavobacterium sp.]
VRENLSWLHKEDGSIEPFTILGSKNVELDRQILEIEKLLGEPEAGLGLLAEYANAEKSLNDRSIASAKKNENLEEKLRKRASDTIKLDVNLFLATSTKKNYTIVDIKNDIDVIIADLAQHVLSSDEIEKRIKSLNEVPMDDIQPLPESKPQFAEFYNDCNSLLKQKIKPSQPIADLINDNLLQEWVRQGIEKHKGKRETCGFCGNIIDKQLWKKLDEHFNKESEELRVSLKAKIDLLSQAKKSLNNFLSLKREIFYGSLQLKFDGILKEWTSSIKAYGEGIEALIFELREREKNIFSERQLPDIIDVSESIIAGIKQFNSLLTEHNKKTSSLAKDQQIARTQLRYSNIAQYLTDINYHSEREAIDNELTYIAAERLLLEPKKDFIQSQIEEKRILETKLKDESKGAELVNDHLAHFFGHNELKLIAEGETPNMKFTIQRDKELANNLSEGECSLISFCYFIAKMQDELKESSDGKKLIIYIDDPISSLDSNHIFFMFSLIESVIAKQKKYGQLFISTHNLDFLKYLKQLTAPKYKPDPVGREKLDINHFIVERKAKGLTVLKLAPAYLKDYITEFNYLFDQIYQCSTLGEKDITHHYQYSFSNNMRKFLEAYMFYKYPTHKLSSSEKLRKYFDDDQISVNLINRVTNEYSHIGEQFERGIQPIDIDEIQKISKAVIDRIKIKDNDQYEALMESIN